MRIQKKSIYTFGKLRAPYKIHSRRSFRHCWEHNIRFEPNRTTFTTYKNMRRLRKSKRPPWMYFRRARKVFMCITKRRESAKILRFEKLQKLYSFIKIIELLWSKLDLVLWTYLAKIWFSVFSFHTKASQNGYLESSLIVK